jgi:hypothetical protein
VKINPRRSLALIVLVGAFCLAVSQAWLASGQDDWDAEGRAPPAGAAVARAGRIDVEVNMNHWICGEANIDHARRKIDSILTLRLDSIERAGGLSKTQIEKLRLAGCNDVSRFFRKVDAIKEECKGIDFNDQKFQQMWPKISALQVEYNAGLFGEKSLFQKVVKGMAHSDSSAPYQVQEQERRTFRHRATIELVVTMFEIGVPLTEVQRQRFIELLFAELKPPKSWGSQEQYVVFYQVSKLDEAKLRPIFDDAQWRALNEVLLRAKGMEAHLKSQGFIP